MNDEMNIGVYNFDGVADYDGVISYFSIGWVCKCGETAYIKCGLSGFSDGSEVCSGTCRCKRRWVTVFKDDELVVTFSYWNTILNWINTRVHPIGMISDLYVKFGKVGVYMPLERGVGSTLYDTSNEG